MPNYYTPGAEGDRQWVVETLADGRYRATSPDGKTFEVDAFAPIAGRLHMMVGGESWDVDAREVDGAFHVQWRGLTAEVDVQNERQKRMSVAGVGGRRDAGPDLQSPMAGKVVAVKVGAGQEVQEGQVVVIVEAMKMENDLKAHKSGRVETVHVVPGKAVEIGDKLVTIVD
jgi:biotin carboxyl carrier protein